MDKPIKIGLVGYGTVGQGIIKILESNREAIEQKIGTSFEVVAICDLRPVSPKSLYVKDYHRILARPDIDIVVELIGGYEPARTLILGALESGKHVVTANKAVLAKHWNEIFGAALKYQRLVYFEASVGGTIPVIQGLNEGLAANRIESISGILNGTTNYILSEMSRNGVGFDKALVSAQKAGFAEADPSFDVNGIDTANKLAVLSSLAWSSWIRLESIQVTGITQISEADVAYAKRSGYVIKLVGSAVMTRKGLELSVQPCLLPVRHAFANVEKEYNAVLIHGDASGDVMFYGKGAGQLPAASAVVSDIIDLGRQVACGTAGRIPYITYDPERTVKIVPPEEIEGTFYLRFTAADQPGVLSRISGILGRYGISLANVYQERLPAVRRAMPIIMLTHRTTRGRLAAALKRIDALPIIKGKTVSISVKS